jgi:hypothetical protein
MRLDTLELMSSRLGDVEDDESALGVWSDFKLESIESNAELSVLSSLEDILPDAVSVCSSFWSNCRGDVR